MTTRLRIATRKSPLALWQTHYVRDLLMAAHPGLQVELLELSTQGDRILDSPLAKIGGKALFVKELEQAMLDGRADLAVHSSKDVPVDLPEGLALTTILKRHDPRDALVSNAYPSLDGLPQGARIGTSSLRRQCLLKAYRPDLQIHDLRGNVGTRLGKLDAGEYDAIILAGAGLERMGMLDRITEFLDPDIFLPAIAQGAIGIECRAGDTPVHDLLASLDDAETRVRVRAERALNRRLMGGCQVPIAGFAEIAAGVLRLRGLVGRTDGSEIVRGEVSGPPDQADALGTTLADDLLARGARQILDDFYQNGA